MVVGDVWKLFYENVMVVLWGAYNNNYNFSKKNTSNWFPSNKSKKSSPSKKRQVQEIFLPYWTKHGAEMVLI